MYRIVALIAFLVLVPAACSDDGGAADSAPAADSAAPAPDSAAPAPDGAVDAAQPDPYSGNVDCSGTACPLPAQICCVQSPLLGGAASFSCKPPASCKAGIVGASVQAPQFCDGPEDCTTASPTCCAIVDMLQMNKSGAYCTAATGCKGDKWQAIVCHTDKDCSGTRTCVPCKPPGPGYTVKMCVENATCPF